MDDGAYGALLTQALVTIFSLAAPALFAGLAVGFIVSIFQAATQINEVTLVFIPKMLAVGLVLWQTGPWTAQQLQAFVTNIQRLLDQSGGGL